MPVKNFIINPSQSPLTREEIDNIEMSKQRRVFFEQEKKIAISESAKQINGLKHIQGRVVVYVDVEAKNWHTFSNGTKIRRERNFNDFNRRVTQPSNAIVVSAENIPIGSEILISHNALHDSNRVFDYTPLSGDASVSDVKFYSIPMHECFAWRDGEGELQPIENFAFGLRVYEPYGGLMQGVPPSKIKDVLYITTGDLKGLVVHTLIASDYEIVYQGQAGREENLIRIRNSEDESFDREEVICINHELTERVNNEELLIGISETDAKSLNEIVFIH